MIQNVFSNNNLNTLSLFHYCMFIKIGLGHQDLNYYTAN